VELTELDGSRIPVHVAIVMDGNGRWAQRRGLPRTDGHAAGEEALMDTIWGALDAGVRWLTVYAFSTENWKRPVDEVRYLMNFNERLLLTRRDELDAKDEQRRFVTESERREAARVAADEASLFDLHRAMS
jgi:undecaprenyl diphosphate synthase